jgi:cytochrome c553
MKIQRIMTGFAALAITISAGAMADDIYRWTDDEGNVYYEDRPSGAPNEERLRFSYNRTNNTAVQKRIQTRHDVAATRRDAKAEAEAGKQTAAENRAAAEARLAKCHDYRAKLKQMLESPRVYRQIDGGERTYLDDTQRAEARSKAEELINETCGN